MEWLAVQEDGRCCGVSTRSIWTERPRWRASLPECPVTRGALRSNHCSLCVRRVRYTKVGIMHDAFIETLYYVVVADLLCALLPCQHIMKNHGTVGAGRSEPGLWENLSIYLSIDQQLGMRRRPCISRHGAKCVDGDRNGIQAVRSPSTSISFTAAMLRRRRHVARAGGGGAGLASARVRAGGGGSPPPVSAGDGRGRYEGSPGPRALDRS
jgi:hypothetical protein